MTRYFLLDITLAKLGVLLMHGERGLWGLNSCHFNFYSFSKNNAMQHTAYDSWKKRILDDNRIFGGVLHGLDDDDLIY